MTTVLVVVVVWITGPPVLFGLGLLVTWPERRRNVERARQRRLVRESQTGGNVAGATTRRDVA